RAARQHKLERERQEGWRRDERDEEGRGAAQLHDPQPGRVPDSGRRVEERLDDQKIELRVEAEDKPKRCGHGERDQKPGAVHSARVGFVEYRWGMIFVVKPVSRFSYN